MRVNRTFNWSRSRMTLFAEMINLFNRDNVRFVPPGLRESRWRVSDIFEQMVPILPSAGVLIEF